MPNVPAAPFADHPCLAALSDRAGPWPAAWQMHTYRSGDTLPTGGLVALVCAGAVRVARPPDRTGAVVFRDVVGGGVVGDLEALAGATTEFTATALCETAVVHMPGADFVALLDSAPGAALAVLRSHAREALGDGLNAPRASGVAAAPLCRELLRLAESDPHTRTPDGALAIARLPRHRELAHWTGLAEEDVAAVMADLVRTGCIARRYPGLRILDPGRLGAMATE